MPTVSSKGRGRVLKADGSSALTLHGGTSTLAVSSAAAAGAAEHCEHCQLAISPEPVRQCAPGDRPALHAAMAECLPLCMRAVERQASSQGLPASGAGSGSKLGGPALVQQLQQDCHSEPALAQQQVHAWCASHGCSRLMLPRGDLAAAAAPGPYQVLAPPVRGEVLPLAEAVQRLAAWRRSVVLLQEDVLVVERSDGQEVASDGSSSSSSGGSSSAAVAPVGLLGQAVAAHCQAQLPGWQQWLQLLCWAQRNHGYSARAACQLEACTAGALLPAHYELRDRLLLQVEGRRRVVLLPPRHAFSGLYPFPCCHLYDGYSMVDMGRPDGAAWPQFAKVTGLHCQLAPGDVLYVPAGWFMHAELSAGGCSTLVARLLPASKLLGRACMQIMVVRAVEQMVGQALGNAGRVRAWLMEVAAGRPVAAADVATVEGYCSCALATEVRQLVDAALGPGVWRSLLPEACAGRLLPTYWLNKGPRTTLPSSGQLALEAADSAGQERSPQLLLHAASGSTSLRIS